MVRIHSGPSPEVVLHQPTITNVTISRNFNVIYQNTGGRPIVALVGFSCTTGATTTSQAAVTAQTGAATPPADSVAAVGIDGNANRTVQESLFQAVMFFVPRNYYYRVQTSLTGTGAATKNTWFEISL